MSVFNVFIYRVILATGNIPKNEWSFGTLSVKKNNLQKGMTCTKYIWDHTSEQGSVSEVSTGKE